MHTRKLPVILIFILYNARNSSTEAKITAEKYALMPELFHLDDFDSCMSLGSKAMYCSIVVKLFPEDPQNHSITWKVIQEVIEDRRNYRHDLLRHGICVGKSCPNIAIKNVTKINLQNDISRCYTSKYNSSGLIATVTEMHCEKDHSYYPVDKYDIAVGIALGMLVWTVIFSTFYEGMARYKSKKEYAEITNTRVGRVITCFSLRKNWSRLQSDTSNPDTDALRAIQGIRFYNTQLVIMAHVALVAMGGPLLNPTFSENFSRNPVNVIFINGHCVVQTFMLITGFLISYNFLLLFEKRKKFQLRYIIMAFVNRYIRLTPCLLVMIALNATWVFRFGRGPMWNKFVGTEYRNCRQNWWTNLLYIHNYYDVENMCMQHTWYLATDTQLFLAALVVISFMWIYQNRIKLILAISIAIGIAMPSIVNYYNNYDIVVRMYPEAFYGLFLQLPQWHAIYSSALTNFGAYALGITFGYIFYLKRSTKFLSKKIYVAVWWVLIWGMPLGVIYYGILIYQEDYQYGRLGAAIYVSLQKNLFALGICLFVYGATENVGWFLRDCIIWSPLQILGRLSYCTYLVHAVVTRIRGGHARFPGYISYYTMFNHTVNDAALSYIFGTLLALFVELPVSALQKLMVSQLERKGIDVSFKDKTNDVTKVTKSIKDLKK